MTIRKELIDELLKEYANPRDILGEGGLPKQFTKALIERCLETELETHLGYAKYDPKEEGTTNSRSGSSRKTLKGELGQLDIGVPRDREGSFDPQLVRKYRRNFASDESAFKVMYLAVQAVSKKWTMPIRDWKPTLNRFAIECAERFPH